MIPWLRRDRLPVLAALALAAGGREPLPEALEQLAAEDSLLRPWARRLCPPLRAGVALPELLRRWRLVSRDEAVALAVTDQAAALAQIATGTSGPIPGALFVTWFPVWLLGAMVAATMAAAWLWGWRFELIYKDLGIKLPSMTVFVIELSRWEGMCAAVGVWLGVAVCWWLLPYIPGLRWLRSAFALEAQRKLAWFTMVEAGYRSGTDRPGSAGWSASRIWYHLSSFRMPLAVQRRLSGGSLERRLEDAGCPGDLGWEEHRVLARQGAVQAVALAHAYLRWGLIVGCAVTLFFAVTGFLLPFVVTSGGINGGGMNFGSGGGGSGGLAPTTGSNGLETNAVVKALAWLWAYVVLAYNWLLNLAEQNLRWREAAPILQVSGWIVLVGWIYALIPDLYGWFIAWWTKPSGERLMLGSLSRVLAAALRQRKPLRPALEALSVHLPWPYSWRLRTATQLTSGDDRDMIAALRDCRVLPAWLARSGAFAHAGSREDLCAFTKDLGEPRGTQSLNQEVLALVCQWCLCGLALWFLLLMVPRKFTIMLADSQVPIPPVLQFLSDRPVLVVWTLFGMLLLVLVAVGALCAWSWAGRPRRALGRALLVATGHGATEARLATQLLAAGCPGDLTAAGERGDWPALAAAAGWPATDAAHLARLLAAAEFHAQWRARIAVLVMRIGTPLVLAIPVGGAAWLVFRLLVVLMEEL